ncbi:MAG: carboxypeptidase regulatory-like domain-containing protein [Acidobacteria bacterium]|nr:carboxypeptidase regulatory-like domain-containing protein [Acidobacteriota bacterium]
MKRNCSRRGLLQGLLAGVSLDALRAEPVAEVSGCGNGCLLTGHVLDPNGARVVENAVVIAEAGSGRSVTRAVLNAEGRYRACLPAGVYSVSLENTRSVLPYRRAAFRLDGGEHELDLWPVFRGGIALTTSGDRRLDDPVAAFDSVSIGGAEDEFPIVIRYGRKRVAGDRVEYSGGRVMLSFDLVTVLARSVVVDRTQSRATAEGGVIVAVDRERATSEVAEFDGKGRWVRVGAGANALFIRF